MVNAVVVDSSVAFKWFHPEGEDGVEAAVRLLDAHESAAVLLVAPTQLHVELANSLRYTRLDPEAVTVIVESLDEYRVELFPSTPARLARSVRLSYRHRMSIYDALFLQLAVELGCPLVTADRRAFAHLDTPVEIRLI